MIDILSVLLYNIIVRKIKEKQNNERKKSLNKWLEQKLG
nr:MAG TPA: hypothetical protein [Caudoviricetes sp.]